MYRQSTLDIPHCQGTNKFDRDIESSTYRVVIFCKLIRMGPIVLFETSRVRLIEYSRYQDSIIVVFCYLFIYLEMDLSNFNLIVFVAVFVTMLHVIESKQTLYTLLRSLGLERENRTCEPRVFHIFLKTVCGNHKPGFVKQKKMAPGKFII